MFDYFEFSNSTTPIYQTNESIEYILASNETITANFTPIIYGCTDPDAVNYNEDANLEDGTCIYQGQFEDCDGNCNNDTDLDEVCDEEDNCIGVVNPNQEDTDNDGEGDACDYNDWIGIDEISEDTQTLIKMIDVLGREQKEHKRGILLFYIYDNGKVEKKLNY